MSTILTAGTRPGRLMVLVAAAVSLFRDLIVILLTVPHLQPPAATGAVLRWFLELGLFTRSGEAELGRDGSQFASRLQDEHGQSI